MKTIKQLLRQPLKTLFGIALMVLAAAILCVCVGQSLAVLTTTETLDHQFSTIATPLGSELPGSTATFSLVPRVEDELMSWIEKTAAENPDIVRQISQHGILSAYVPELTPLNVTAEPYVAEQHTEKLTYYRYQEEPYNMPYSYAMLVVTLNEIGEPEEQTYTALKEALTSEDFLTQEAYWEWYNSPESERMTVTTGYTLTLTGTVTDVISLQEGSRDPTGRIAYLTITLPELSDLEALELVPGEQYVVYGMDYVDEHRKLIGELNQNGRYDFIEFEPFDASALRPLTDWELSANEYKAELYHQEIWLQYYGIYHGVNLTREQYDRVNAISLTLSTPISLKEYEQIRDEESGLLLELREKTEISYTDFNGSTVTVGFEEYAERYRIPTIARLDGSVEDFLSSEEGALWAAALERDSVNAQAFAVIGVDKLGYWADFGREKAKIVEGRDFTAEELESGARVCIVYEALATANGLKVGDTITANLYGTDPGLPYQSFRTGKNGLVNPTASFYFDTTPFTETAEYTVVGICRGEQVWPDVGENEYALSPNTVIVPKSSVQTEMEYCSGIPFITVVLQNGKIEEFHTLAARSGYAGRFKYADQGYSVIAGNFHNYETLARQVLTVGIVVYAVLLLLFLLLFPAAQKGRVKTMASLGAPRAGRFGCVLLSSTAIVLPASLLGGGLGSLLWDWVLTALQASAEATLSLETEPGTLAVVTAAQFILALVLNAVAAVPISAAKGISARR